MLLTLNRVCTKPVQVLTDTILIHRFSSLFPFDEFVLPKVSNFNGAAVLTDFLRSVCVCLCVSMSVSASVCLCLCLYAQTYSRRAKKKKKKKGLHCREFCSQLKRQATPKLMAISEEGLQGKELPTGRTFMECAVVKHLSSWGWWLQVPLRAVML